MVAICEVELVLPGAGSLKGKRHIVKSILERIRARTKGAAAEVGRNDAWQRAALQIALVASDRRLLTAQVELVRRIVDDNAEAETVDFIVDYVD